MSTSNRLRSVLSYVLEVAVMRLRAAAFIGLVAAGLLAAPLPAAHSAAVSVGGLATAVRIAPPDDASGVPEPAQFRIGGGGIGIGMGGGGGFRGGGGFGRGSRGVIGGRAGGMERATNRRLRVTTPARTRPGRRPGRKVAEKDTSRPSRGKGSATYPKHPKHPDRPGKRPHRPKRPIIVVVPPVRFPPREIVTVEPPVRVRPPRPGQVITPPPAPPRLVSPPPVLLPPLPPVVRVTPPPSDDIWPDEIVVFITTAAQPAGVDLAVGQTHNLQRLGFEDIALAGQRIVHYRITDGRSVPQVVTALSGDPRVALVSPNYRYVAAGETAARKAPVEGLAGTVSPASAPSTMAALSSSLQYALAKLRVIEAHAIARGRGVTVAIIDSGIDTTHPALADAVVGRSDFAEGRGQPIDPHGTAIAGVIRARGDVAGVAPSARLLGARAFFRETPAGKTVSSTYILARALYWSVEQQARVVNMSFAGPKDAALAKAIDDVAGKGLILVAAAGNNGEKAGPAYPAAYPGVIAVTAIDTADTLYTAANRGAYVALAAPGVNVLVVAPKGGYGFDQGTSIAAAHVSGIVALLLERQPTLRADEVRRLLAEHAVDLGSPGRDELYGAGRVDAMATLSSIRSSLATTKP